MRSRLALLAAAALATLGSPVPIAAPADAAPVTCRGERATIVGRPGQPVVSGTDRRDVIVSNGAFQVQAGKGHDLVCLRGGGHGVTLVAGPGDDDVWVEAGATDYVFAVLGAGADEYHGSSRDVSDYVDAAASADAFPPSPQVADTERDVILTGGGRDSVEAGVAGRLLADRIDLGTGRDFLTASARGLTRGNVLRAGAGSTLLVLGNDTGAWTVDNGRQVIRTGGERRFAYTGFRAFSAMGVRTDFVGTDHAEHFASGVPGVVRMGGGDDRVQLGIRSGRASVSGGSGSDVLRLVDARPSDPIVADVTAGTATTGAGTVGFGLFERHEVFTTGTGSLTGTDGPDHLVAEACTLTVDGGAGNDRLVGANEPDFFDESDCTGVQFTLRGGSGADRISASAPGAQLVDGGSGADVLTGGASRGNEMRGGLGDDRLLGGDDPFQPDTLRGGPGADYLDGERGDDALFGDAGDDELYGDVGDDTADGGADDDLCRAETTANCERA